MIRIMFIIPSASMKEDIAKVLQTFPNQEEIEYRCLVYTFPALDAYEHEWPCDVLIARGYTADVLAARNYPFPVLKIVFNSVDVINAVKVCRERFNSRRIAVIGHPSLSLAAETINQISDIPIRIYTQEGPQADIPNIVDCALKDGNDTVIGGGVACLYADQIHVNNYMALSNRETLYQVISEAINTVSFQRQKQAEAKILRTVTDNSSNGCLIVGLSGKVTVCSRIAEMLLGIRASDVKGVHFSAFLPELEESFKKVMGTKESSENEMLARNGQILAVCLKPIIVDGMVSNVIVECRDINKIQEQEGQIRKKLFAKGMVARYQFTDIIHVTEHVDSVIKMAQKFARADSNVLIVGETGTGKELFAQSMHAASSRKNCPFVAVNCAAIPEQLLESELFGYSAGAFTGALKEGKRGLFELAHAGTIFLDEISELPYSFQGKLLRVLQEREIRRIGDERVIPVDVRVIAATNRSLEGLIDQNLFRNDLYFRLNVLVLQVPALRERPEDVFPIFCSFLQTYSQKFQKSIPEFSISSQKLLRTHVWKGNIRELKNIAERFMVLYEGGDNPDEILLSCFSAIERSAKAQQEGSPQERERIARALKTAACRDEAAGMLGISRSTLWRKMKQYHLK